MRPSRVESGTFWVMDPGPGLLPIYPARTEALFDEAGPADVEALSSAMSGVPTAHVLRRFQHGRRCFLLRVGPQIAAYGWMSTGSEHVGELEREFRLRRHEAYVWDCGTVPQWRGQGLYSHLLSQIVSRMDELRVQRIWIGASRQNRASVKGIVNAGFQHVLDLKYRRFSRLTTIWFHFDAAAPLGAAASACSIIMQGYERRFGRLAVGWYPKEKKSQ